MNNELDLFDIRSTLNNFPDDFVFQIRDEKGNIYGIIRADIDKKDRVYNLVVSKIKKIGAINEK